MNFKKMLAGTFAGIVATSAVATAASAAQVQQEAYNETLNVKSYKSSWSFDIGQLNVVSSLAQAANTADTKVTLEFPVAIADFSLSFTGNTATGSRQTLTVSPKNTDDKKFEFEVRGTQSGQGYSNTQTLNLANFGPNVSIDMNMKGKINHGFEYLTEGAAKSTTYARGTSAIFRYKKNMTTADWTYLNDSEGGSGLENKNLAITPRATAIYTATNNPVVAVGVTADNRFYPVGSNAQDDTARALDSRFTTRPGYYLRTKTAGTATSEFVLHAGAARTILAMVDNASGTLLNSLDGSAAVGITLDSVSGVVPTVAGAAPVLLNANAQAGIYGPVGSTPKAVLDKLAEGGQLVKYTGKAGAASRLTYSTYFGGAVPENTPVTVYAYTAANTTTPAALAAGAEAAYIPANSTANSVDRQDFTISLVANAEGIATGVANRNAGQFNREIITTQTAFTMQDYVTVGGDKPTATDKDVAKIKKMDELIPGLQVHMNDVLGNTKGATITFNFVADAGYQEYLGFNWNYDLNKMFGIRTNNSNKLQLTGYANKGTPSITFDWDTIIENSGLTINSTGLLVDTIVSTNGPDLALKVDSITIDVPENSFNDLSAGEGTTDSADDITPEETTAADPVETVAPVVTDAPIAVETTAAAVNPSTGNAPIALAVIPVAIAAAAIIAKKRG